MNPKRNEGDLLVPFIFPSGIWILILWNIFNVPRPFGLISDLYNLIPDLFGRRILERIKRIPRRLFITIGKKSDLVFEMATRFDDVCLQAAGGLSRIAGEPGLCFFPPDFGPRSGQL